MTLHRLPSGYVFNDDAIKNVTYVEKHSIAIMPTFDLRVLDKIENREEYQEYLREHQVMTSRYIIHWIDDSYNYGIGSHTGDGERNPDYWAFKMWFERNVVDLPDVST